jgi:cell division initiation protein
MKITPIDIRQKEFEKAFRGYEKEEVDAFLTSLSQEWEKLMEENKELRKKVEAAEKEVSRLREVENTLFRTLKTAEDTGANMIDQATKTAELHLREAQMQAESILNDARSRSRTMIEEAEEQAKSIQDDLTEEIKLLERDYHYIENQKENLLLELKNLVNDTLERAGRYSGKQDKKSFDEKLKAYKNPDRETRALKDKKSPGDGEVKAKKDDFQSSQLELQKPENKRGDSGGDSEGSSFFDNL